MILKIVKYPEPVLSQPGEPVTEFNAELAKFVADMFETMYASQGIGLAAPQVAVSKRVTVIDLSQGKDPAQKLVIINPEIIFRDGRQYEEEGCLSFPEIREKVVRAAKVRIRAQDLKGKWLEMDGEELLSRAFQHEIDHLDGMLFIFRMSALKRDRTPRFAVSTMEALRAAGHEIALVVSQPDRPVGRTQQVAATPVKQIAIAAGLAITQPEKIKNNPEFRAQLEAIAPDAIVVVAYGRIIPPWMLALPRLGCINLHASLLPKYRGAAPIQWAVAMGETFTGNTTMLLEEGLDTGPILLQQALAIGPEQTAVELFEELANGGAPMMVETMAGLAVG